MARQIGNVKITGTIDGITFYRMDGEYYAREKSSLSRKRVLRDPVFAGTRQSAGRLGRGSQLASRVYRALEKDKQQYALFCALKRVAVWALKEGKSEQEVLELLQRSLEKVGRVEKRTEETRILKEKQRLKVPSVVKGLCVIPKGPAPNNKRALAAKGRTYRSFLPSHTDRPSRRGSARTG